MKTVIMRCPSEGRFHFGKLGLDENASLSQTSTIIHSDTLFSALLNICAKTFPDKVDGLKVAFDNEEIVISSAFYCLEVQDIMANNDRTTYPVVYFLPKPVYFELFNTDLSKRKAFSKIAFISKGVWEYGFTPPEWTEENGCLIVDEKFVMLTSELDHDYEQFTQNDGTKKPEKQISIYKEKTSPKIADHARRTKDNIFFQTDLVLANNLLDLNGSKKFRKSIQPHFYCLLDIKPNSVYGELVKMLFSIMEDEGIGGAISTGCGRLIECEIGEENFEFSFHNNIQAAGFQVSVSLIHPAPSDTSFPFVYYKTITRGGRKIALGKTSLKRVKMLKEGALIQGDTRGGIPQIHDSLPYFRNGKALCVPIHPKYLSRDNKLIYDY